MYTIIGKKNNASKAINAVKEAANNTASKRADKLVLIFPNIEILKAGVFSTLDLAVEIYLDFAQKDLVDIATLGSNNIKIFYLKSQAQLSAVLLESKLWSLHEL